MAKVSASVQARLDRLAAENVRLRDRLKTITDADTAQEAREAKHRIARYAHRDGTSLPIRHSKSSAKAVVLFAGQTHGDVAISGLKPMAIVRAKSGVK